MKAVLMAGGVGSRLRPLTIGIPKPMIPVVNKPVMAHTLDLLKSYGITDVVATLQYRAEVIQSYFRSGSKLNMNLTYSVEDVPLGTAGGVRHAGDNLNETFIVISGDAMTDFNLKPIIEYHYERQALATIVLTRVLNPLEYGVIITDTDGRVTHFQEKPSWGEVVSDTINTGIYIFEPEILEWIPKKSVVDWSKDVFPRLLANQKGLFGYVAKGYWCDIGNIPEYFRACADLLNREIQVPEVGEQIKDGVWVGKNVQVAPSAQLVGPIYLDDGVKIKDGVVIYGPTSIHSNTVIDKNVRLTRCHVWQNSYIGIDSELSDTLVGKQCNIKAQASLEDAILGDNNIVGERAVLYPGVKVWPNKEIESGAVIKSSIIWGTKGRRNLFGQFGISGVINVDLTPEVVTKLGASFAATLPAGSWVTVNQGPQRTVQMLKRAIMAGLPSAGVNVWDLQLIPTPVARYYTRASSALAGVDIRASTNDYRVVDLHFINEQGLDLDHNTERNIEWVYFREDFRRADVDDIGNIEIPTNIISTYQEGFLKAVDSTIIRSRKFRLVIDYFNMPNAEIMPEIFAKLNIQVIPLNAHIDKIEKPHSRERWLQQLSKIVRALSTDFGAQLDTNGEKIHLITDRGALIPNDLATLMLADLALRANEHTGAVTQPKIVVPVNQTRRFDELAQRYHAQIIRTKSDLYALMRATLEPNVILAADGEGRFIFPAFQPVVDGMMALVKLIEFMALLGTKISQSIANLAPFHITCNYVECPWDKKGQVMRLLNHKFDSISHENMDGLKIFPNTDSWVLIRPDPYQPRFEIYAEAATTLKAQHLVNEYQDLVKSFEV